MNLKTVKNPKIVMFDPDPFYKINLDLILQNVNMEISDVAANAKEINKMVKDIENGEIDVDIVIISNHLVSGWLDGEKVAKRIKNSSKNINIVSYSIDRDKPDWSDEHAIKSGLDNEKTILVALRKVLGVDIKFESSDNYD